MDAIIDLLQKNALMPRDEMARLLNMTTAEVEAAMLLGALGASRRARPQRAQPDQTSAAFWADWPAFTLGPLLQCASSDGVACPTKPVQVDANTTAGRPKHHLGSSRVGQASPRTM